VLKRISNAFMDLPFWIQVTIALVLIAAIMPGIPLLITHNEEVEMKKLESTAHWVEFKVLDKDSWTVRSKSTYTVCKIVMRDKEWNTYVCDNEDIYNEIEIGGWFRALIALAGDDEFEIFEIESMEKWSEQWVTTNHGIMRRAEAVNIM
jgi:hypothetical protein